MSKRKSKSVNRVYYTRPGQQITPFTILHLSRLLSIYCEPHMMSEHEVEVELEKAGWINLKTRELTKTAKDYVLLISGWPQ